MKDTVSIRITAKDISENVPKFKTHTDYVKYRFAKDCGVVVHDHSQLMTMRSDSDTYLVIEYVGKLGNGIAHRPDEARVIVEELGGTTARD